MVPPKLTSAFRDDDIELLRRARTDRDAVAYGRFVDLHLGRVFNQANRATGRYDEAAIVTEQAFGSVLSGPDDGLTPYVALGRRVLAESVAAPAEDRPTGEITAIPEGLPSPGPVDEAPHQAVIIANSHLPAEQRLALVMRELDGANYQRIGQTLGRGRSSGADRKSVV